MKMSGLQKKSKVGRNDPCPCGSGKKFKRCHGVSASPDSKLATKALQDAAGKIFEHQKAAELQREKQQGLGKPIISWVSNGERFVAVNGKTYHSPNWKTFHDFLHDYIKHLLGGQWANDELKKPQSERHPLLTWYEMAVRFQNQFIKQPGKINIAPMTGAITAYLNLAYSLYLIAHNVVVQEVLLKRLMKKDSFYGAAYETLVAGMLVRAGFDIEFEEENDPTTSHCEFTATFRKTGKSFSVEAKKRELGKTSVDVGNQLYAALRKNAKHTRLIYIEVNMPDDCDEAKARQTLVTAALSIKDREQKLTINKSPAPPAYVIVTNNPHEYSMNNRSQSSAMAAGFKIPDFGLYAKVTSLHDIILARQKHVEMFSLMESSKNHYQIPGTFDGEIPELIFGQVGPKIQIGQKYSITNPDGAERTGELIDAVVVESRSVACCILKDSVGTTFLADFSLTSDELMAYKMHPNTFFGIHKPDVKQIKDPLDLYDSLFSNYKNTSKEILLGFLRNAPDYEKLKGLPQKELAETYCERFVTSFWHSDNRSSAKEMPDSKLAN